MTATKEPDHAGTVAGRLRDLRRQIANACQDAGRGEDAVTLLAVSKAQSTEAIVEAWRAGQKHFGENYWQELEDKRQRIDAPDIIWHFIGRLQSRKARAMANHIDWVHSVSRIRTARCLHQGRAQAKPRLNVCVQLNLFGEQQKDGVGPEEAMALAEEVASLSRLRLRGLMTILPRNPDGAAAHDGYARLNDICQRLRAGGLELDTLSMGMSGDWKEAVRAGSTIVRLGTALFGSRKTQPPPGAAATTAARQC